MTQSLINPTLLWILLWVLLFLSAFFAMSETSIMALSRIRLRHLVAQGRKRAKIIQDLVNRLDHLLATILVANNFVNVAFTALATVACIKVFGQQ